MGGSSKDSDYSKLGKEINLSENIKGIILIGETGEEINCQGRFYTQNIAALTTSSKRDGHGLLGKHLIEINSTYILIGLITIVIVLLSRVIIVYLGWSAWWAVSCLSLISSIQ